MSPGDLYYVDWSYYDSIHINHTVFPYVIDVCSKLQEHLKLVTDLNKEMWPQFQTLEISK